MDVESKLKLFEDTRGERIAEAGSESRKRIENILDQDSFLELNTFVTTSGGWGKEIIIGAGTIDERPVFIFSQCPSSNGGVLSGQGVRKILALLEQAGSTGTPLIGIFDGSGIQVEDNIRALQDFGQLFSGYTTYSGVIPLITVAAGPCPGGLGFIAGLSDFVFSVQQKTEVFINSPQAIKEVTGEEVSGLDLGGAGVLTQKSGVSHFQVEKEEELFPKVKNLFQYLPLNNMEEPPLMDSADDLNRIGPDLKDVLPLGKWEYNVKDMIKGIADQSTFFEVQAGYADNLVTGFIRLGGQSVGVLANQPGELSGALDLNSCQKGASFIRFCDAFNMPILTLVDVPGFLPSVTQEQRGIIRNGAKLIFAYSESVVPKITVITGKCYGSAGVSMGSKFLGIDQVFAWPTAEIGALTSQALAGLLSLSSEETDQFVAPYDAAAKGLIDDVIVPEESRAKIIYAFEFIRNKRKQMPVKKHGNFPV
ncbi:acyl-CoA carboxylase subunit beta [Candidatus Contubernalis alkaliaceticus]|uniref:acyl-CoA carboxylase subunit beta n=1 Tax=Candidatus Contubernalis alkaliaceticus TaxID=338645 RepID=UPI001F4C08F2|nr:carboxyl transferase domain-containing protein [Candidatus Contubernalis alkalaceticus]UNC91874.1 methylmalonyl-CoA carboxyltransferase [Candidatus Contubernalis alkalaceticus]